MNDDWIIKLQNTYGTMVGYYRGESGLCADRRDAKIYQSRSAVDLAVEQLRATPSLCQHFTPVQLRR